MMKLFIVAVLVSIVHSAPHPATQYIIYEPSLSLPQHTIYSIPERIVQTTSPFLKYGKQNLYYYLPASPLTSPYQIIMFRDDASSPSGQGQNQWDQFVQAIQMWFGGQESGASGSESGASGSSDQMKKITDSFEMMDKEGNLMPESMKREEIKKLYILITQQPQLVNQVRLWNPYATQFYYAPYAPLIGRSLNVQEPQPEVPVQQVVEQQPLLVNAPAQVVPESVPLVKAVEPVVDPVVVVDPLVAAAQEQVSPVQEQAVVPEAPVRQVQARFAEEEKVAEEKVLKEMIEEKKEEEELKEELKEEIKKEELKEELKEEIKEEKLEQKNLEIKESDDPSVAQSKPEAIALAGKGGLSAASPVATSVVGDGGIAVSAPQATSIAGEFPTEEEEKKQ